jgi:hypothetical protein
MNTTIIAKALKTFDDYVNEFAQLNQEDHQAIDTFWSILDADLKEKSTVDRANFMQQFLQSLNDTYKSVAKMKPYVFHQ